MLGLPIGRLPSATNRDPWRGKRAGFCVVKCTPGGGSRCSRSRRRPSQVFLRHAFRSSRASSPLRRASAVHSATHAGQSLPAGNSMTPLCYVRHRTDQSWRFAHYYNRRRWTTSSGVAINQQVGELVLGDRNGSVSEGFSVPHRRAWFGRIVSCTWLDF